jgi:hypothetical protein
MAQYRLVIKLTQEETSVVQRLLNNSSEILPHVTALVRSGEFDDAEGYGASVIVRTSFPALVYVEVCDGDGDIVAGAGEPLASIYQEFCFPLDNGDEYTIEIQPTQE